jgi:hypothetical protein
VVWCLSSTGCVSAVPLMAANHPFADDMSLVTVMATPIIAAALSQLLFVTQTALSFQLQRWAQQQKRSACLPLAMPILPCALSGALCTNRSNGVQENMSVYHLCMYHGQEHSLNL